MSDLLFKKKLNEPKGVHTVPLITGIIQEFQLFLEPANCGAISEQSN